MPKVFNKRDAATAFLKKAGVPSANYASLIEIKAVKGIKQFIVEPDFVKEFVDELNKPVPPIVDVDKQAKQEKRASKSTRRTVSSVARELILQGLDNNATYAKLVDEFALSADKKYYPAWYRSELRRKGHSV
jgi:hypothetical protein